MVYVCERAEDVGDVSEGRDTHACMHVCSEDGTEQLSCVVCSWSLLKQKSGLQRGRTLMPVGLSSL